MTRARSLPRYLLLPRPGDTVKLLILPAGFVVGAVARGLPDPTALLRAALVWACLELLVYQARYQWNDIRGFEADQRHPDGDRGRLPGPLSARASRTRTSGTVAVVKVVGAVLLCGLAGRALGLVMGLLTLGVFGLAAVYEALRATSTGRSSAVPAPITPGIAAIWCVIGAGYALRAVTGLGLSVDLLDPAPLLPLAIATCWAFGTAWITSRWAVEATAFARPGVGGELTWQVQEAEAKEHQLALTRWLPPAPPGTDPRRWRAVRGRTPWIAPWNVVGALAGGLGAATGFLLVEPDASALDLFLLATVGAVASAAALAAGERRALGTALGAVLVLAAAATAGTDHPLEAILGWLVLSVAQLRYLGQDRASLGGFPGGLLQRRGDRGRAPRHLRSDVGEPEEDLSWTSQS